MIKTLRITSIVILVLAAAIVVLGAVSGWRSDDQLEQFLASPGAVEQFIQASSGKRNRDGAETSPLVKQAEAFALYLNPPAPVRPKAPTRPSLPAISAPRPMAPVSAKFDLVGTCVHSVQPELSLALVDQPGKGMRWIRQGDQLGRLVIEQVRDGAVSVRDGERTFEMLPARPEKKSLEKDNNSTAPAIRGMASEIGAGGVAGPAAVHTDADSNTSGVDDYNSAEQEGQDQEIVFQELLARIKAMSEQVPRDEANELDQLGRELRENLEPEPNDPARRRGVRRVRPSGGDSKE